LESLSQTTPAITKTDENFEITQSAIAFGEYANVTHAKEILSMLFLQAGSTIVEEQGNLYVVTLNKTIANGLPPAEAVLNFYTQFVAPGNTVYTWNRSQPEDSEQFLSGKLGVYFGLASERGELERKNPNLDFDMTSVPQGNGATTLRDYGTFYAFAIPKASQNQGGAYALALTLSNEVNAKAFADAFGLAPALRSLFNGTSDTRYGDILNQSALIARGWLDPGPSESGDIFKDMIETITSGRARTSEVITDTVYKLGALFK
jgi:hypothetical protein